MGLKLGVFRVFPQFHCFYLVTNFRNKSEFAHVDRCGPKFAFSVLSRTTTNGRKVKLESIEEHMICSHLLLDFLIIHKAKQTKNVLNWRKWKSNYFSHKNGIQWSLMDKRKSMIYFQTKNDFLDSFLQSRSLFTVQVFWVVGKNPFIIEWLSCTNWQMIIDRSLS